MESRIKLFIERAENELILSESLFKISQEEDKKAELKIKKETTFYSAVISHSYYCVFYCAKAYLMYKGMKTEPPEEHKKTYKQFAKFVKNKELSEELIIIYDSELTKAESLLSIFKTEKIKRGKFTYEIIPQANKHPAEESLNNATKFFKTIYNLIGAEK